MCLRVPRGLMGITIPRVRTQIVRGFLLPDATILANSQTSSPNDNESWTASSETTSPIMAPSRELKTVETYSIDAVGTVRDGKLHLVKRSTATQGNAPGKAVTEETIEQPAPTNLGPWDLKIVTKVSHVVIPKPSGTVETTTTSTRDFDGNFTIVPEETSQHVLMSPADQPK